VSAQYSNCVNHLVSSLLGGTLTLASNDPFAQPAIDFGLFSDQFDVDAMLQVMKDVQTFVTQAPWNGTVVAPFGELGNATTDALKVAYIRAHANTVHHPMSTARMAGPSTSGVVDSQLRVKGASGLRVIDASTFVCMCLNKLLAS
jgi:choline dehydrogenase-like flavoprotein